MSEMALATRGLNKSFGSLIVAADIELSLPQGVRYALIGPNGAGKTTLINMMTGMLRPDGGSIFLGGDDITALPPEQRVRLGLVRTVLIPAMSPQFFSGLHLGMARAMKGMIVGQVVVGIIGIGEYEAQFQQVFDSVGVWSIAVLLVGASLAMTWIVKAIESFVNHWAYRT